jgi:hypothetical protein
MYSLPDSSNNCKSLTLLHFSYTDMVTLGNANWHGLDVSIWRNRGWLPYFQANLRPIRLVCHFCDNRSISL